MTKRAVLIGSQTYGLAGCNADVALMDEVLRGRGFDAITALTDDGASRAGIVHALDELAAAAQPDDAVVVYFSGHGGRVPRPDAEQRKAAGATTHFHFIVPFDIDASEPGDFRGLLSEEITLLQARLTDSFLASGAAPNVTVILDCCHSGYFARQVDVQQKSVDLTDKMFRLRGIREHAQQLGEAASALAGATNPHAVRLVACQPEQSAYEMASARGGRHGAMTDAFASVVSGLGDRPVAWSAVIDLVRRRVRSLVPEQRPDVEGPAAQALFSTDPIPAVDSLPVVVAGGVARIECAMLLGVQAGDELGLQRIGTDEQVGVATVVAIDGGDAVLAVSHALGVDLPADVVAVRRRSARPRYPVAPRVGGPVGDALVQALEGSARVRPALGDEPVLARVELADGLVLVDRLGATWRTPPWAADPLGIRRTVDALDEIAVGRRLLDLPSGVGPSALDGDVDIALAVVLEGRLHRLERHGGRMRPGERVSLGIRNRTGEQLFAWVFDVGVSGRATLLTNASPSGALLGPAGSADDAIAMWSPAGQALFWPRDVPFDAGEREETFVIVLADRRGDLSSLATPASMRGALDDDDVASLLTTGLGPTTREIGPPQLERPLRYRVEEVSFFLTP